MSALQSAVLLLIINLGLLWLLMRAPLGRRTICLGRIYRCSPDILWKAMNPAGPDASWHHSVISSRALANRRGIVEQTYRHLDKNGAPSRRLLALEPLPYVAKNARGFQSPSLMTARWTPHSGMTTGSGASFDRHRMVPCWRSSRPTAIADWLS